MSVTKADIDEESRISIGLAVAQWTRSPRATQRACEQLRARGVDEAEILARRRAGSADPALAGLLRLAVTLIITRGQLDERDLRRQRPHLSPAALRAVVAATSDAFYDVLLAEALPPERPGPAIDMEVGEY